MDRHYRPAAREVVSLDAGLAGYEWIGTLVKTVADAALAAIQIGFAVDTASKAEGARRETMEAEKTRAAEEDERKRILAQAEKTKADTLAKLANSSTGAGASSGLPAWALPVGIGAGVLLLLGGGYLVLRKK